MHVVRYAGNDVILADEMGLGKTIQTIGFLRCLAIEKKVTSTLLRHGLHGVDRRVAGQVLAQPHRVSFGGGG